MQKKIKNKEFLFGLSRSDFLFYLPLTINSKVLEIECGFGTHAFNIANFVKEIVAVDSQVVNINFCEKRKRQEQVNNINFLEFETEDLNFPRETFDVILISNYQLLGKNERIFKQCYQWLKPQGTLYFGVKVLGGLWCLDHYRRYLQRVGFSKEPQIYIAYPSHLIPRFMIPKDDTLALNFILNSMTAYKGFRGKLIRGLIKAPLFTRIFRNLFSDYAFFVKK